MRNGAHELRFSVMEELLNCRRRLDWAKSEVEQAKSAVEKDAGGHYPGSARDIMLTSKRMALQTALDEKSRLWWEHLRWHDAYEACRVYWERSNKNYPSAAAAADAAASGV